MRERHSFYLTCKAGCGGEACVIQEEGNEEELPIHRVWMNERAASSPTQAAAPICCYHHH